MRREVNFLKVYVKILQIPSRCSGHEAGRCFIVCCQTSGWRMRQCQFMTLETKRMELTQSNQSNALVLFSLLYFRYPCGHCLLVSEAFTTSIEDFLLNSFCRSLLTFLMWCFIFSRPGNGINDKKRSNSPTIWYDR